MVDAAEPSHACYNCKEELVFEVKIGRRDLCPNCGAYLHACYNCEYWDPNVHNECKENQGEFIRDRAQGNFCLYFTFKTVGEDRTSEQDQAKAKLEALFGGGGGATSSPSAASASPLSKEDEARAKLEALFKK